MDANLNALEGGNATALVLLAQHCVTADVKIRLHFNSGHNYSYLHMYIFANITVDLGMLKLLRLQVVFSVKNIH